MSRKTGKPGQQKNRIKACKREGKKENINAKKKSNDEDEDDDTEKKVYNNNNNNKLYLHDSNKVLQYYKMDWI